MTQKTGAVVAAKTGARTGGGGKLGRLDLDDRVRARTGLTLKDSKRAVGAFLEVLEESLLSGNVITLKGIGTLSVVATKERSGVKPGTAEKIQIPAGKKVKFKAAAALKAKL